MASNSHSGNSGSPNSSTATPQKSPSERITDLLRKSSGNGSLSADPPGGEAEAARGGKPPSASTPEGGDGRQPRPALEIDDDDEAGDPQQRQKEQRRSLQAISEETGIPLKKLYEAVVDLGVEGEEPVTIGTLKDRYREIRDFEQRRDTFEAERDTYQNEVLVARGQVQGVVDRLRSVVGDEAFYRVLGDVHQEAMQRLQTSRAQLLEWYPHWSDPVAMKADREEIESFLATYGIPKFKVAAIQDAVVVKIVKDAISLKKRFDRLKAGTPERQPTTAAPSRKAHRSSTFDEAKAIAERTGDPKAGVAKLLGG